MQECTSVTQETGARDKDQRTNRNPSIKLLQRWPQRAGKIWRTSTALLQNNNTIEI